MDHNQNGEQTLYQGLALSHLGIISRCRSVTVSFSHESVSRFEIVDQLYINRHASPGHNQKERDQERTKHSFNSEIDFHLAF